MRIRELDGLRGIAVLAVINHHYLPWLPITGSGFGWLGVDLFFVLSGFLITGILLELRAEPRYFRIFYSRRALRIFPPYYLALTVYLILSAMAGKMASPGLWLEYVFYYSSLFVGLPPQVQSHNTLIPALVAAGLTVLWSLSVEEIYYTVWAPVVRFTNARGFTAILVGMSLAAPILRWALHTPQYPELFTFYCRMDGLALGSMVALLLRERDLHGHIWRPRDRAFDAATAVVIAVTLVFWVASGGDRSNRLVSVVGVSLADLSFAFLVHAVVRRAEGAAIWLRALRARWLASIGMVSYSLYLVHYPLRFVAHDIVLRLHLPRRIDALTEAGMGVALSLGFAYVLWYAMESRILRWKNRTIPTQRPRDGRVPD